jgi:uracil-DNA glycosylase
MAPPPSPPTAPKTIADFFVRPAKRLRSSATATVIPAASLSSSSSPNPSSLSPEQRRRADTNLALARARRNLRLAESKGTIFHPPPYYGSDSRARPACRSRNHLPAGVVASGGAARLEELLVEETWLEALDGELRKPYALDLCRFVTHERTHGKVPVYPPTHLVFHALHTTPFNNVKAVIIGQVPNPKLLN